MTGSNWKSVTPKNCSTLSITLAPILFSLGVHLTLCAIVFMPTSFFSATRPETYSVQLINLSDPQLENEPVVTPPPLPEIQEKVPAVTQPVVSTTPILSTRNIPQTPTEIKILRPRKFKKDLRKNQRPIDQSMVLAALERLKQLETQEKANRELTKANEAVAKANDEALQALRESILIRQPLATPQVTSSEQNMGNTTGAAASGGQSGQQANSTLNQYIATIGHHIGTYWRLPEGQHWDNRLNAIVHVKIKDDGIVISSKIAVSSKSKQFDKFVLETIQKASPLPAIPATLDNKPLKLHFYPQGLQ